MEHNRAALSTRAVLAPTGRPALRLRVREVKAAGPRFTYLTS